MQAFSQYRAQTRAALDIRRRQRLSQRVVEAFHEAAIPFFGSAGELFDFQHDMKMPRDLKDDVIGALLRLHLSRSSDETYELLLGVMFPKLSRLFALRMSRARWGHVVDSQFGTSCWPDETWARVLRAFGEAITGYPIEKRPGRFAENIAWLTIRFLRASDQAEQERVTTESEVEAVMAPISEASRPTDALEPRIGLFDLLPDEEAPAAPDSDEIEKLDGLLEECGIANALTRRIVIAAAVHEQSLAAIGLALGLKKAAVQRRYERARERLARELTRRERRKQLALQIDGVRNGGKRDSWVGGDAMIEREAKPNAAGVPALEVQAMPCPMCEGTGVCRWPGLDVALTCEGCGGGGRILTCLPTGVVASRPNIVGRA